MTKSALPSGKPPKLSTKPDRPEPVEDCSFFKRLRAKHEEQGMWALYGEVGQVLKRGHELAGVLFPLERRLFKVVEG